MQKKLKDRWVGALRNGKRKQGVGKLRNKSGEFCCLGVLADIRHPSYWENRWGFWTWNLPSVPKEAFETVDFGPESLRHFGLLESEMLNLIEMNDELGNTFSEIADWVETNIPAEKEK